MEQITYWGFTAFGKSLACESAVFFQNRTRFEYLISVSESFTTIENNLEKNSFSNSPCMIEDEPKYTKSNGKYIWRQFMDFCYY